MAIFPFLIIVYENCTRKRFKVIICVNILQMIVIFHNESYSCDTFHYPSFNITNTIIFIHVNINSTLVVKFICLVNSHPCVLILGLWSMSFKKKFLIFSKALHVIDFIHEINCICSVDLIQEHNFIHHQVTTYCSYGQSHCAKFHQRR